ncbi:uracil-DNA glycosylase [Shimia sp. R9_3]|uniref:uracil-DNA glycosylase n=1 Tax=Shimia sp. R9_3 TaxID=2821113 RepID=UPI001ADD10D6|nr:uracil-DNA glycosylase [Shimia sp. R9_3]MBO9400529.1 uracil-DNA glycosylase [Shimia sp. R9_3]
MRKLFSADHIVAELQNFEFDNAFNPYRDVCQAYDHEKSADMRAEILFEMLVRADEKAVDAIWIGRDLGYRGGRRTGLALTDDVRFSSHLKRWGIDASRPTKGQPVAERTASIVWDFLDLIEKNIFLWNVFPFHPHAPYDEFSNRTHNAAERRFGERVLKCIQEFIRPEKIIAIGNDASKVAVRLFPELKVHSIRHPSYGGQAEIASGISKIYSIEKNDRQPRLI